MCRYPVAIDDSLRLWSRQRLGWFWRKLWHCGHDRLVVKWIAFRWFTAAKHLDFSWNSDFGLMLHHLPLLPGIFCSSYSNLKSFLTKLEKVRPKCSAHRNTRMQYTPRKQEQTEVHVISFVIPSCLARKDKSCSAHILLVAFVFLASKSQHYVSITWQLTTWCAFCSVEGLHNP